MRILIDGMDLSGKTTLAGRLRRRLEARGLRVRHTRYTLYDGPHARLARLAYRSLPPGSLLCAWAFVAAALVDRVLDLVALHGDDDVHIHEAHAAHTVACAAGFGHHRTAALLEALSPLWPRFDQTLLLTAGMDTRRARMAMRAKNDANDLILVQNPARFQRMNTRLCHGLMVRGATILATDGRSASQVEQAAVQALRPATATVHGASRRDMVAGLIG
jgi:dTMP kinase